MAINKQTPQENKDASNEVEKKEMGNEQSHDQASQSRSEGSQKAQEANQKPEKVSKDAKDSKDQKEPVISRLESACDYLESVWNTAVSQDKHLGHHEKLDRAIKEVIAAGKAE